VAGLESVLDFLEGFQFSDADMGYLRSLGIFDAVFLRELPKLRFTGSVRAMPEGSLAFADEPVLEVTAPIIEAQLVETYIINQVTVQTTLLTKAARVVQAAEGRQVVDFGARRTQGTDAADLAARCGAIAGFAGTSNVRAAARFGLIPVGTMAHSFIQSFGDELAAFRAYAAAFPDSTTLLVDTYDTLKGVQNAITVAKEMEEKGHQLRAVRLDSGDMAELAKQSRAVLDAAGLDYVKIVASGGLDEHRVANIIAKSAPVDSFGVGTRFGVSADAPYLDSAYKLVQYGGKASSKFSPGKRTLPGPKQVYRFSVAGHYTGDIIATASEPAHEGGEPLIVTVMEGGRRTAGPESIDVTSERLAGQLERLPRRNRLLVSPADYPVAVSDRLQRLSRQVEEG
jgi:nicotinate phosphoribosyltransferase